MGGLMLRLNDFDLVHLFMNMYVCVCVCLCVLYKQTNSKQLSEVIMWGLYKPTLVKWANHGGGIYTFALIISI